MSKPSIETTPPDLMKRMEAYPAKVKQVMELANKASIHVLWEKVPSYPPTRPNQQYVRTGTLGRSLGSSESGGAIGSPDVFQSRTVGAEVHGEFGTNVIYAGDVIGDGTQKPAFEGRWWTISTIFDRALEKIIDLHVRAGTRLVQWLSGGSI